MEKLAQMEAALINNRPQTADAATMAASIHTPMTPDERAGLGARQEAVRERKRQLERVCSFRNYQQLAEAVVALNKIVTALDAEIAREEIASDSDLADIVNAFWPKAKSAIDRLDL